MDENDQRKIFCCEMFRLSFMLLHLSPHGSVAVQNCHRDTLFLRNTLFYSYWNTSVNWLFTIFKTKIAFYFRFPLFLPTLPSLRWLLLFPTLRSRLSYQSIINLHDVCTFADDLLKGWAEIWADVSITCSDVTLFTGSLSNVLDPGSGRHHELILTCFSVAWHWLALTIAADRPEVLKLS